MKKKTFFLALALTSAMSVMAQSSILNLSFTAVKDTTWEQLDSVKITNLSQGGDTVLYWPDTVLSLAVNSVGISEISSLIKGFRVFQNHPNPVLEQTMVSLFVPEEDKVSITITDILGRVILQSERRLERGKHSFRFYPGESNLYFFTAQWKGNNSSIKILHTGLLAGTSSSLQYTGRTDFYPEQQAIEDRNMQQFSFTPGDELLYIGYANNLQSGMMDVPDVSQTYTFQFATNIPCPGTPTVEYGGQVYNTIQILSQCWLKENLNAGVMINGVEEPSNNGIIEKYCFNNNLDNCTKYGGLYQWNELMEYSTIQGTQGICPPGWHLPTDSEWKVLEGAVDSQFGIGDSEWDNYGYRGFDANTVLRTTSGWFQNGNGTDLFGFSGLPGGLRYYGGPFYTDIIFGYYATSTDWNSTDTWGRRLFWELPELYRLTYAKDYGVSARCVLDH